MLFLYRKAAILLIVDGSLLMVIYTNLLIGLFIVKTFLSKLLCKNNFFIIQSDNVGYKMHEVDVTLI